MSTPRLDSAERQRVADTMRAMQPSERRAIGTGRRLAHINGRLDPVPPTYDRSQLRPDESPLSFTDCALAALEEGRFIGIDCSLGHYCNKAWENHKVLSHLLPRCAAGTTALNIGGGSSPINVYLASLGARVVSLDSCAWHGDLVSNERAVAQALGLPIEAIQGDFLEWEDDRQFDFVFSICVIEHLPSRQDQAEFVMRMARRAKPGGRLLLTFGYGPNATDNPYKDEKDVKSHLCRFLTGFRILEPFSFSGLWTLGDGHTWGFLAAEKRPS